MVPFKVSRPRLGPHPTMPCVDTYDEPERVAAAAFRLKCFYPKPQYLISGLRRRRASVVDCDYIERVNAAP
ncbi:hypothetical protein C8R46DRAFT_1352932 [Mycena filopes]|nr:hypothetical protein C8R46DRAFT_1352932 [Mycena filopes]